MNNTSMRFESFSPAETMQFAAGLTKNAQPGDMYCLSGDLGMGKTVFSKGFAQGLGYGYDVTSPTFTLMNIYEGGSLTLYHFDLYRLDDCVEALEGIGYEDYFYTDGVCLVEWAERARKIIPDTAKWVRITGKDNYRLIEIPEWEFCV